MKKIARAACLCLALTMALAACGGPPNIRATYLGQSDTRVETRQTPFPTSAPTTAPTVVPTAAPTPSPDPTPDPSLVRYYLSQIAFSSEYGGSASSEGKVRKWEQPILIQVSGSPTDEDLVTLDSHIEALGMIPGMPDIRRVASGGSVEMYFVPLSGMAYAIPGYVEGNWGYFQVWWDSGMRIEKALVGITTDVTTQEQRNHLILEEVTQMLGLMQDSDLYEDSIFYAPWTETQALSELDWQTLYLLYRPDIRAGMTWDEVIAVLAGEGAAANG
ncbi:MAG: DUF2927 domain-containing protein [Clostridiales bacterium]|nr:DUF2927 domain-containing protein [Clostridiales bacterium]